MLLSITIWSSFIQNHGQIRILHPRLPFGQVLSKTMVRLEFSTLDYPLVKFYLKPWSDSDSPPSITFWSSFIQNGGQIRIPRPRLPFGQVLFKTVVRFGFSILDYPLVKFYSKRWSDSDSPPTIILWSSFIQNLLKPYEVF